MLAFDSDRPNFLEPKQGPPADPEADKAIEKLAAQSNAARRYETVGEIAQGGMGEVLEVFDQDLQRPLAMKVIRRPYDDNPSALRRFLAEARVHGQLQHPDSKHFQPPTRPTTEFSLSHINDKPERII